MRRLQFLALLIAITAATSQSQTGFEWPDSSRFDRALVNVNQFIESRPPGWFAHDKLVTDFAVVDIAAATRPAAPSTYSRVRDLLQSRGMIVGTYTSGTTVKPDADQTLYPPSSTALEQMPQNARYVASWPGQPRRKIIDVTDAATRHALQAGIRTIWQKFPAPVRFVDNAGVHPAVSHEQPWSAYCANIREIRQIADSVGSRAIFNISLHVGYMSDSETQELIEAVGDGGIALEMPWHQHIQDSPAETRKAVARYRQLLDSGMAVVMIPVSIKDTVLANWVRTWRKPTDHLYISGAFWKQPDLSVFQAQ